MIDGIARILGSKGGVIGTDLSSVATAIASYNVQSKDIGGLQAEVGKHEHRLALDSGASGMNDLIHLCDGVVSALKPGGFFAFEVNYPCSGLHVYLDYMDWEEMSRL
ncbi:putative protein phosphatase 2C 66-like [Capsicum annuum]|nr:putative protein phosphatase 2C 66-like [Capsicum annuum]KAF3669426.1 putative protein phosphatase 2C 66-like [Capsicum annuum]